MQFGVSFFPTDTSIDPVELAMEVEGLGFESLWFAEHSHIPVSRATPWGGVKGASPLPEHYWHTYDSFVTFGAIASVTTTLRLCTGITLLAQRDPLWTAKEVATLDRLSNGRVIFGIGYGWNREEMAAHGVAYTERRAMLREKVLAMKALWTQEVASFEGRHVHIEPSWAWPKPVQQPHPPIVLGGAAGPKTIGDIVEFCDGWMPTLPRHDVIGRMADLRSAAEAAGRDPDSIEVGVYGGPTDRDGLARLAAAGVRRAVMRLPQGDPAEVLARLHEYAPLIGTV